MAEGSREGVGANNCFNRPVVRLKQLGGGGEGGANCEHQKGIDLVSKNTITLHLHHTIWYISLPSLYADYT